MRIESHDIRRRGCLFIVSGPSGAGKTSICTPVLARLEGIELSVSFTTRKPRRGERHGVDYHFVGAEEFTAMVGRGAFAEWAEVHGNRYGTAKRMIDGALDGGRDLVLDIDVQGARQIKAAYREAVAVFLLPPSKQKLEQRLIGRGTDDPDVVAVRLRAACLEIAHVDQYDYVVVNEDLEAAVGGMLSIVHAERMRVARIQPPDLTALVRAFDPEP